MLLFVRLFFLKLVGELAGQVRDPRLLLVGLTCQAAPLLGVLGELVDHLGVLVHALLQDTQHSEFLSQLHERLVAVTASRLSIFTIFGFDFVGQGLDQGCQGLFDGRLGLLRLISCLGIFEIDGDAVQVFDEISDDLGEDG